jgi:hypothetical protein
MQERLTPEAMRLRRSTVEHPFATIKYRIFGHPRLLMRGLSGVQAEIGIQVCHYSHGQALGAIKTLEVLRANTYLLSGCMAEIADAAGAFAVLPGAGAYFEAHFAWSWVA